VPDLYETVFVTPSHEVDDITRGNNPPQFFCARISNRKAAEPAFRHLLYGTDDAFRGWNGDDVKRRDRHHLTFLLCDMGLEFDRPAVESARHFQEPVAPLGATVILVHNHPPI
jgi:hypothetical protein